MCCRTALVDQCVCACVNRTERRAAAAMPKAKKEPMRSYNAFVLNKHKYSVKDPILVQSKGSTPFIGEIVKIEANPEDSKNVMLTLHWFYRPEVIPFFPFNPTVQFLVLCVPI